MVILLHNLDDDSMQYHSHMLHPFGTDVRWVAMQTRAGANRVRSHFEKAALHELDGQHVEDKPMEDDMLQDRKMRGGVNCRRYGCNLSRT